MKEEAVIKEPAPAIASESENALDGSVVDDEMTAEDLAALCETRATTYGWLARIYRSEVDEPFLEELCAMEYPVETGSELMDVGYYIIAKWLSNAWVDPILRLSIDYTKTFLGSGIDTYSAAYPYESVYTSEKRLLMQDARDEVLAIYRANRLDKSDTWNVGEDHIAVELEFMRILNDRAAQALRDNDMDRAFTQLNTQRNFLLNHMASWIPVFTQDVRRFAETMFYEGVSYVTEGFLEEDLVLLDSIVDEDR